MTQPFSFPYPTNGTIPRATGQGCKICVHNSYCPAVYWFVRYTQKELDDKNGILCASWSSNPVDKTPAPPNQRDLDEVEYIWNQGIGSEPDRNGITDQVVGTWRRGG